MSLPINRNVLPAYPTHRKVLRRGRNVLCRGIVTIAHNIANMAVKLYKPIRNRIFLLQKLYRILFRALIHSFQQRLNNLLQLLFVLLHIGHAAERGNAAAVFVFAFEQTGFVVYIRTS